MTPARGPHVSHEQIDRRIGRSRSGKRASLVAGAGWVGALSSVAALRLAAIID